MKTPVPLAKKTPASDGELIADLQATIKRCVAYELQLTRTIDVLVAAGVVTREKVDEARAIVESFMD